MRNRIMSMLDIVSLVQAVRQGTMGLDRSSALVVWMLTGLAAMVTGVLTWIVDWLPTWRFANGESPAQYGYTAQTIGDAAVSSAGSMANAISGVGYMTLGSFIGGCIAVGITLLPTIVQFIAPRVIHPVAKTLMDVSVGFDFITDWPAASMQAEGLTTHPIGHFTATIVLVFLYSLLLQSVFVLFLTAFVFSTITLVAGGERRGDAVVVSH